MPMNNILLQDDHMPSSPEEIPHDNTSTLLDPKLEVIDSNTPLFFMPQPPLDNRPSETASQSSHLHQTVFNSMPLGDMHQINTFMSSPFSTGITNFTQNSANYLEFIDGNDSIIETTNITSTEADRQCQMQDISDKGLQIRVLGVSQSGAKSRVETQIKLCLQLVTDKGEKVPLWSHLRLPEYMVAKEKLKTKNARNHPDHAMNISEKGVLNLEATVVCASEMPKKVLTCLGCVQRERKRSQRKKENKHSKANANATPSNDEANKPMDLDDEKTMQLEQRKILLFNCSEIVDFSSGDTILPTRITCYCRHHNEKVGFCIYFVMKDYAGTVIACGMSPPIMITDDHKSSKTKVGVGRKNRRSEYDRRNSAVPSNSSNASKHNDQSARSSPTPSNSTETNSRSIIPTNIDSSDMPSSPVSIVPTQNSNLSLQAPIIKQEENNSITQQMQLQSSTYQLSPPPISPISPISPVTPLTASIPNTPNSPSVAYSIATMSPTTIGNLSPIYQQQQLHQSIGNGNRFGVANTHQGGGGPVRLHVSHHQNNIPRRSFYHTGGNSSVIYQSNGFLLPRISRLIPSEGPTYGGVEVTVLGSNFYEGLTCVFGDTPAAPTQYWSPNTLVCLLPPCPTPGPVPVSFKEHPINLLENPEQEVIFFAYIDALMELALQVVGMKMTGKIEDARNIAMRIVGGADDSSNSGGGNANGNMNGINLSSYARQISTSSNNLEEHIIATISLMDAIETEFNSLSLQNRQQHTMLHIAAMLGYKKLCEILIERGIEIDVQDKYGFTALHYAAWTGEIEIVRCLLYAGSNDAIRNFNDQSASDLAMSRNYDEVSALIVDYHFHDSGVSLSPTSSEERSLIDSGGEDSWYDDSDEDCNEDDRNISMNSDIGMYSANKDESPNSPETENNTTPHISWVDAKTASDLMHDEFDRDDEIVDAEVVEDEKKYLKQPLSEIATDLATASTIWLQKTFAHMHMPTISKPSNINITLPNIKMPNLQMPNLQMPNLHNFSSPKLSTMTF
ncbi:6864_t:CDS:10, partial [Acaulospora morrowiae]